jgi:c-di-GMP-binding flagellar brake protein YcgR
MSEANTELLRQGIERNLGAVISLPSAGMLRHHKSRFLASLDGGILMEAPMADLLLINELIGNKSPCGVAFRNNAFKVMFASAIRRLQPNWKINELASVDAMILEFPAEVKSIQRRSNYRAPVPMDFGLSLRVWRIGDRTYYKEHPLASQEIKVELKNLSVGGVGIRLLFRGDRAPEVFTDERVRVQLVYGEHDLLLEGRMRAPTATLPDQTILTGIQFKKLENNLEGRQQMAALTRIVGELQRDEARKMRNGLVARAS